MEVKVMGWMQMQTSYLTKMYLLSFTGSMQNMTIEERVSLLEIQVVEIQEDLTEVDEDVTLLEGDVNFLFDEQVIQDERLLRLEDDTDVIYEDLDSK